MSGMYHFSPHICVLFLVEGVSHIFLWRSFSLLKNAYLFLLTWAIKNIITPQIQRGLFACMIPWDHIDLNLKQIVFIYLKYSYVIIYLHTFSTFFNLLLSRILGNQICFSFYTPAHHFTHTFPKFGQLTIKYNLKDLSLHFCIWKRGQ